MSYSADFRECVLKYRQEGHTLQQTQETFKIAVSTIRSWEKMFREKGNLTLEKPGRSFRKIDPEKLRTYVEQHPDAYKTEMANAFGCSNVSISRALKKLGITRKKDDTLQRAESGESKSIPG